VPRPIRHEPTTLREPRARRALGALALALGAVLGVTAVAVAAPAASAGAPAVTVSPTSDLVDGQYVTVTWSGFTFTGADKGINIRQCSGPDRPATVDQCSSRQPQPASGSAGSDTFFLRAGPQGNGVVCDSTHPCTVVLTRDEASRDLTSPANAASVRIDFAPDLTTCPDSAQQLTTLGTDAVSRLLRGWQTTVCQQPFNAPVDFTGSNDGEGRQNLARGTRDVALSELPLSAREGDQVAAANRSYGYAPVGLSGLVFAYNLRDVDTQQRIIDLKMTPKQLVLAMTGQIANWNDAGIPDANGRRHPLPAQLKAVARADACATTLEMTTFFEQADKADYEAQKAYQGGATNSYPSTGAVDLRTGGPAVAQQVAAPSAADFKQQGFLGVMDSSVAALYGLPTVRIIRGTGADSDPAVALTPQTLAAAYDGMTVSPVGTRTAAAFDPASVDTTRYPLPTVTYAISPTSPVPAFTAATLRSLLRFAAGDGQDKRLPDGYVALPRSARETTLAVAAAVREVPPAAAPSAATNVGRPGGATAVAPGAQGGPGAPSPPAPHSSTPAAGTAPAGRKPSSGTAVPPVAGSPAEVSGAGAGLGTLDPGVASGASAVGLVDATGATGATGAVGSTGTAAGAASAGPGAVGLTPAASAAEAARPRGFTPVGGGAALVLPVLLATLVLGGGFAARRLLGAQR